MIKLKLSFGDKEPEKTFDISENELLSDAVARALVDVPLSGLEAGDVFQVVVNGMLIEKDFWALTKLNPKDSIVITPNLRSGDSGQIFKQVLIVAITAVASVYLTPAGGATVYSALSVAAVSIGSTLLLNALIPPPVPEAFNLGGAPNYEESQMYSIAAQSNTVKQFQLVPKPYGVTRMFPNVAANPYTELQVDLVTGDPVQYLYVIYDFGLGPARVSDLKIGDTPLTYENFDNFYANIVDLNRPSGNLGEGVWDFETSSKFTLYKGQIEGDALAVALNSNEVDGGPQADWEAIRDTAVNVDGVNQEIILQFVNPIGLYGYSASGVKDYRRINLDVSFAPVGTTNWQKYNDPNYVTNFDSVGGKVGDFEFQVNLAFVPGDPDGGDYYTPTGAFQDTNTRYGTGWKRYLMIKDGTTKLLVYSPDGLEFTPGRPVYLNSVAFAGNVVSAESYDSARTIVHLDRPVTFHNPCFLYLGSVTEAFGNDDGGDKIFIPRTFPNDDPAADYQVWIKTTSNGLGIARIQRAETGPVYAMVRFTPINPGQYQVRVRRTSTSGPYGSQVGDQLTWGSISTRFDKAPIVTDKRHVFLELKIKATSQLNGTIQNLSGITQSVCEVYNQITHVWEKRVTNNPAWIFTDLLIGEVNKKAVDKSRLHLPSILEWANYCDAIPTAPIGQTFTYNRFQTNFVLDYSTTLQDVLNQIAGAAQASLNVIDGKYGVLLDTLKTTPVQIFTPRNSKDFSSVRVYGPRPDALKIKYVDPGSDWNVVETVVYDDGFDATNATVFEEMTSFACTNDEQAWRFGRYMIAQNKLRQETITISVDFEYLVCTRGDFVQITQDVMKVGGSPGRVKAVAGNIATINDELEIDLMLNYGYVFRGSDGVIVTSTCTPIADDQFQLDGDIPNVGDLIVIGEVGSVVFDCIVKAITPNDDLSATLTLVEKADAIYAYESSNILPDYDPQISNTSNPDFAPPGEVNDLTIADFGHDCAADGNSYEYFFDLVWNPPQKSIFELYSILVDDGSGYNEIATTRASLYHYIVDPTKLDRLYKFKVIAVSATGKKLPLGSVGFVSGTPVEKTTPPSDVEKLNIDITNETLTLSWDKIDDCDAKQYTIRYSTQLDAIWETSIPLVRVDAKTSSTSVQARTGSYFIKALDFNGNESLNAAEAITTIPTLFNLNVIDIISDTPAFDGGTDRVQVLPGGGSILLADLVVGGVDTAEYYPEGFYYFDNLLDVGDIYTVRLQSQVQAEGFATGDLMSNWVTLDSVLLLASTVASDWNVETQYRSTDNFNVIADWVTLDSIAALNEGLADNFSDWRTFFMGDATGRVFQFRLRLISNKSNVTPRVFDATIRADMPDRVDSFENLVSDVSLGYTVNYSPSFKGPSPSPNVQISIDGASAGDYWTFDYKTVDGFLIRFFDKNNVAVARQFDVAVKGYGRKTTSSI